MNHVCRTSPPRRIASSSAIVMLTMCALASGAMLARGDAQESRKSLSVPATITAAPAEESEDEMPQRPRARVETQATLPGGKLPQYQLTPRMRTADTTEQIEDAAVRFLLALPAEPVLVEARIMIDGEPFRKQREQRIQAALKAALNPAAEPPAPPETDEHESESLTPLIAEKPKSEDQDAEAEDAGEETTETPRVPAYQSAASNVEKLRRYIDSIGREPSLEEVRWFFINRLDGPTLLLLKDQFQAFRSGETPVFHILDRNRDGAISSEEIGQAVESFHDCDLNRNQIVDYLEINESANDPRLRTTDLTHTGALLYLLPDEDNAAAVYAELLSRYGSAQQPAVSLPQRFDADSNGQWEPGELNTLRTMPADITLTVNFDTTPPSDSALSVSEDTLKRLEEQQLKAEVVNSSIVLYRPDCELWLSATQLIAGDQVSLGAVSDGYPMLPVLDPNDDGRFTVRELRGLTTAIRQFDLNGDGQILKEELRPTIRVCFGLGSTVHQALAGVRTVHPPGSPQTAGPGWFVRMDLNKDNDLSRQEFPGTDEQFGLLDTNKDKLISAEEALEADRQNSPSQPEPKTSEPSETEPSETENDTSPPDETTNSES